MAAEVEQHIAAAAMGIGKIRLLGDRAIERGQCLVMAAEPVERHAEQFMRAGICRIDSERFLNDVDRFCKAAALAESDGFLHQSCGLNVRHCRFNMNR
jgi:hypothetical protein